MNLIPCDKDCINQVEGYCNLAGITNVTGTTEKGCLYLSLIHILGIFLERLFSFSSGSDWMYYLRNYLVTFLLAIFCSIPLVEKLYNKIKKIAFVNLLILAVILIVSIAYLVDATYNPFLYFRF